MKLRLAMMTVEVLVAMVIIFLTIVLSASTVKYFNMSFIKKEQYVDIYTTVLSIKDKIEKDVCIKKVDGRINGFSYTAKCRLIQQIPNYQAPIDIDDIGGNIGSYMMKLYQVSLEVKKDRIHKNIDYYVTKAKKR